MKKAKSLSYLYLLIICVFFGNPIVSNAQVTTWDQLVGDHNNPALQTSAFDPPFENFPAIIQGAQNTPPGNRYRLSQSITLNNNTQLTLTNCILVIDAGVSITLQTGSTLEIHGTSHLFSCGNMWQGIIAEPGSKLDIGGSQVNRTVIEDAETAILCDRQNSASAIQLHLRFTDFDHNNTAVKLMNGAFPFGTGPGETFIYANNFKCTGGKITKHHSPGADYYGQQAFAHVWLENVTGSANRIGTNTGTDTENLFSDTKYGIYSNHSSFTALRNYFNSPSNADNDRWHERSAIKATGNAANQVVNNITIGDDNFPNQFTGWANAISCTGVEQVTVMKNTISDCYSGIEIRKAIFTDVHDNTLSDFHTGIGIYDGRECRGCILPVFPFENRVYDNHFNPGSSLSSMLRPGHMAIEAVENTGGTMRTEIRGNEIVNAEVGIHVMNLPGVNIGFDMLSGIAAPNTIKFQLGASPAPDVYCGGIWVQNCKGAKVVGNEVSNDDAAGGTQQFIGIDVEASPDCNINCNNITNLAYSMRFFAGCEGSLLRGNQMDGYEEGIHLDGATLPDQYQWNIGHTDEEPADNQWLKTPKAATDATDRVTGAINFPGFINWYYEPGAMGSNPFDPLDGIGGNTTSPIINTIADVQGTIACDDWTDRKSRDEKFGAVVGDSLQFEEYENENKYTAKANAYKAMKEDISLLDQGTMQDAAYQEFYDEISQSNIGLLDSVNEMAADSNLVTDARTVNENINDTNSMEYYKKSINDVYLRTIAIDSSLSLADSSFCDYVSDLSYYSAGEAKYIAAAMIGKEVHPVYVSLRKAKPGQKKIGAAQSSFSLYPNPAASTFSLAGNMGNLTEVELLDGNGRQLKYFQQPLKKEYSIAEFENGLYQVRAVESSGRTSCLKLCIIR